jgi:L-asparaginase
MATRNRICLIYTGGTIGMIQKVNPDGDMILQPAQDPAEFLHYLKVEDEVRAIADLDLVPLMNKDSTNMVPSDWTAMAEAVYARLHLGYTGFVIAHGTDTMHFSSSALAFAFGPNLHLPIVFTGAQTIPDVSHGDARVNLLRAVRTACEDVAEVVVTFGDYIFRGCRVQKKDERRFDAFEAPAEFPLAYITEEILVGNNVKPRPSKPKPIAFKPHFADGIVQFSLIPGLKPSVLVPILEQDACFGIVLQSFGAGNVPNDGEYSFRGFIERAVELNKPVIIASQFPANSTLESHYEPGVEAVRSGAIPTGNMTNAAATVKFRWALHYVNDEIASGAIEASQKLASIAALMNTSYVGEITERKSGAGVVV